MFVLLRAFIAVINIMTQTTSGGKDLFHLTTLNHTLSPRKVRAET